MIRRLATVAAILALAWFLRPRCNTCRANRFARCRDTWADGEWS